MLIPATTLKGFQLGARDGEIGRVKDFYFDDQQWAVRYMVVDTNKWLPGRKVLISPLAVREIRRQEALIPVELTREQIEKSPHIEEHMPVSRQFELEYYTYYNWPYYWIGPGLWGPAACPPKAMAPEPKPEPSEPAQDPHLRSANDLHDYFIHARDHHIGHVTDFILDTEGWQVRYLEIDTRSWWPGKHVLAAAEWVREINWHRSFIAVDMDRDLIQSAPEYRQIEPISREFEKQLFAHYGREPYWNQSRLAA